MLNYLVSGVTGCIGLSLIKQILKNGDTLRVILNPSSQRNHTIEKIPNIEVNYISLNDYGKEHLKGNFDVFIHMAWQGGSQRSNFTLNQSSSFQSVKAIEIAASSGCKRFISIGSQAEYGPTNEIINEKLLCSPNTEFGIAKLNTFYRLKTIASKLGIEFSWLRVLSAYGPNDRLNSMLMNVIMSCKKEKLVKLSNCLQYWDFLHADDIANALIKLSTVDKPSNLYVIGSDEQKILRDYVIELASELKIDPNGMIDQLPTTTTSDINLRCDSSKIRTEISWSPSISFKEGIRNLISCNN